MRAVKFGALRTLRLFSPERCAQQHADRDSDGQPGTDVAGHHSKNGAQRRTQRETQSRVFRRAIHNPLTHFGERLTLTAIFCGQSKDRSLIILNNG